MNSDRKMQLCIRCKVNPREYFGDGEVSWQCVSCNDRDIRQSENIREWEHYHSGEPCPAGERDKIR